jgi:hypothetical protein
VRIRRITFFLDSPRERILVRADLEPNA